MSDVSIGKEVLEVAIEIEANGVDFYESLAKIAGESNVWDTYTYLAEQEREHENMFKSMLGRLGGYKPPQEYPGEHYEYIKGLADSSIFTGERAKAALVRADISHAEALEIGIGFEKDSILLYSEMQGLVPQTDKEIVDMVIEREKDHLRQLTNLRNQLDD